MALNRIGQSTLPTTKHPTKKPLASEAIRGHQLQQDKYVLISVLQKPQLTRKKPRCWAKRLRSDPRKPRHIRMRMSRRVVHITEKAKANDTKAGPWTHMQALPDADHLRSSVVEQQVINFDLGTLERCEHWM